MEYFNVTSDWVRDELTDQRRTQSELAQRLGVGQAAVSKMLTGNRSFSVAQAKTILEFFGYPTVSSPTPVSSKEKPIVADAVLVASAGTPDESEAFSIRFDTENGPVWVAFDRILAEYLLVRLQSALNK